MTDDTVSRLRYVGSTEAFDAMDEYTLTTAL
jgi:hypothetical protein